MSTTPRPSLLAASAVLLLLAASAPGQTQLQDLVAPQDEPFFGSSVAAVGDLDGDGFTDVVVGDLLGPTFAGCVHVYSGKKGEPLLGPLTGTTPGDEFGFAVGPAGDIDGDGVPDLMVGAPIADEGGASAGEVTYFSGATGEVLRVLDGIGPDTQFGWSVDLVGDVNKDGFPDAVIGAPRETATRQGSARVYSGKDGSLLRLYFGDDLDDFLGMDSAGAGDVDADGYPDIVVGAPQGPDSPGYARVYSGLDGLLLLSLEGGSPGDGFGSSVDSAGDVDLDGFPDLIVGAPSVALQGQDSGAAFVYSGSDGAPLQFFFGEVPDLKLGFSVAGVGDVDQDGHADVALGTDPIVGGTARVHSGDTGEQLLLVDGFPEGSEGLGSGVVVAAGGDLNADGVPDVLVGVPTRVISRDPGRVLGVSGVDLGYVKLDGALAGSLGKPLLDAVAYSVVQRKTTLRLLDGKPLSPSVVILGFSQLLLPYKGGKLVPFPDLLLVGLAPDTSGGLTLDLPFPEGLPPGTPVFGQAWILDRAAPFGFAASNGLQAFSP